MKWWVYVILAAAIGVGVWKHFVTFDPLNLVVLAALLWTQYVAMQRQQQLADQASEYQKQKLAALKANLDKLTELRQEIRRLKQ